MLDPIAAPLDRDKVERWLDRYDKESWRDLPLAVAINGDASPMKVFGWCIARWRELERRAAELGQDT